MNTLTLPRPTSEVLGLAVELAALIRPLHEELAALRLRIETLEQRPPSNLRYLGVWQDERKYMPGNFTTYGGSLWHCNHETGTRPGNGDNAWVLVAKRGRDGVRGEKGPPGLPGRDAPGAVPS